MRRITILAAAAAACSCVPLSTAAAAPVSGPTTISLVGSAADDLAKRKVRVATSGGAETVKGDLTRYLLPATTATFSSARTTLTHGGRLTFSRRSGGRTRKVQVRELQLRLGKRSDVRAKVGGKRLTLATLDVRRAEYVTQASGAVVRLTSVRASLTKPGAEALRRGLRLSKLRRSGFAVISATASGSTTPGAEGGPAPVGTAPTTPGVSAAPPGAVPGPGGEPLVPLPQPRLARPASAVDVTASSLRWRLRESFVRYISEGQGVTASAGATGAAAEGGVVYDYDFTPAPGSWADPASGQARLLFSGRLHFGYAARGIDIQLVDPEVELNGTSSRLIATFASGRAGAYQGPGVFGAIDLAAAGTGGTAGPTNVFAAAPVALTAWANESVMSGFYPAPDDAFGATTISYTRAS